jgi:RiboL-PSP-HEPN
MAQSTAGPYPRVDQAVLEFSARLDSIRQDLYYCDVNFAKGRAREVGRNVRAAAYVYAAAAVEHVVMELLAATLAEITAACVELRNVRLSLFVLARASHFDSLQQLRGLKMWTKRSEVFGDIDSQSLCVLDVSNLPIDGRTVRPEHLETVWSIFGFSSLAMPDPLGKLALNELADARNSVAHGEDRPSQIGGQTSVTDMLRLLDRVEGVVIHMWTSISDYLVNQRYLRT